ncbi:MAG: hypothetical protein Ta2A_09230 [Treponemataceae bacterium]|nr:MAG: hypothetical protein Ta2A_09230 [Treponemataceae bacterium]
MKTTEKWNKMFLLGMTAKTTLVAMLAFSFFIVGCNSNDSAPEGRADPILGESFTIKGQIYGYEFDDENYTIKYNELSVDEGAVTVVAPSPFTTLPIEAKVTDEDKGKFSVKIKTADEDELVAASPKTLYDNFFALFGDDGLSSEKKITSLSPANANFGVLSLEADVDEYEAELRLGIESRKGDDTVWSGTNTVYTYVYVDTDVTIQGSEKSTGGDTTTITVDLALKKGWNVVEMLRKTDEKRSTNEVTITYSVKGVLESAKWYLLPTP